MSGRVGLGLAVAAVAGLVVGVATSYLQGVLPGATNTLANSGAVWSVAAFVIVLATTRNGWAAVVAGALALLGEVAGYYAIATPWRGLTSSMAERVLWTAAALVIGPVVGLAAAWWAGGQPWRQLAAAATMCGIVAGEGLHGLVRIDRAGPQWWTEVILGFGLGVVAIIRLGRSPAQRAAAAVATLGVAAAIFVMYGIDRYVGYLG